MTILAETPPRIAALADGLSPGQLRAAPAPGEWSANEVLAHLRSCSDVWGSCIEMILAQDTPTIRAVNPKRWIKGTDYPDQPFQPSFDAFAAQRSELLALLETLPPDAWTLAATFTGAGRPIVRTLQSFAQRLATHERPHIKQIDRIVTEVRRYSPPPSTPLTEHPSEKL